MSLIKLQELEAKNIRSYEHFHLQNLADKGLVLLSGINGCGKSTIRNVLEYLLLDTTAENISTTDITKDNKGGGYMRGVFTRDNNVITIEKWREHKKFQNAVRIDIDGHVQEFSDRRDGCRAIAEVFKINPEIVFSSTLFSSKSLSFPELGDKERKNVLYTPLQLDKYTLWMKEANDKISELEKYIREQQHNILLLDTQISQSQDFLEGLREERVVFEKNKQEEIYQLESSFINFKEKDVQEKKSELKQLQDNINQLQDATKDEKLLQENRKELQEKLNEIKIEIAKIESKFSGYRGQVQTKKEEKQKYEIELSHLQKKDTTTLVEILDTLCVEIGDLKKKVSNETELENSLASTEIQEKEVDSKIQGVQISIKESETVKTRLEVNLVSLGKGTCPILNEQCELVSSKIENTKAKLQPEIDSITTGLVEITNTLHDLKKQREAIILQINNTKQALSIIKSIKKIIADKEKEFLGIEHKLLTTKTFNETLEEKRTAISTKIVELEYDITTLTNILSDLEKDNSSLKQKQLPLLQEEIDLKAKFSLLEMNKQKLSQSKVDETILEKEISKLENFNTTLEEKRKDILLQIEKARSREFSSTNREEDILNGVKKYEGGKKTANKEIIKTEDLIQYYQFWSVGYSPKGIPNMKIENVLDEIEGLINENLSKIYPMATVSLEGQTQLKSKKEYREKIDYRVFHPDKTVSNYESYSSGEKQRIKVADLFAFSQVLRPFDFVFLDEMIEQNLDDKGVDDIIRLLKEKTLDIGTIFVVSHSLRIKDRFDTVFNIERENGVSKIL